VIIPERVGLYCEALKDTPILLVGVRCNLAAATARELARTDRPQLELDVPWFGTVHAVPYDAEVDTSTDPPIGELAAQLVDLFENPPVQRAFARLLDPD
jgi:chloramphenicol 3-O-phosphotransferase